MGYSETSHPVEIKDMLRERREAIQEVGEARKAKVEDIMEYVDYLMNDTSSAEKVD